MTNFAPAQPAWHRHVLWPTALLGALGLIVSAGCSTVEKTSHAALKSLTAGAQNPDDSAPAFDSIGRRVRFDGGGLLMGQSDALAYTPETLLQTVCQLAHEEQSTSITRLIRDYPDVAVEVLQSPNWTVAELPQLLAIAAVLDEFLESPGFWSGFVSGQFDAGAEAVKVLERKRRAWQDLENNRPQQVLEAGLSKSLSQSTHPMIKADCYRIEAIAAIMHGEPEQSLKLASLALEEIGERCPWYASKLKLLYGEFLRHADRPDDWKSVWSSAVVTHSQLLQTRKIRDPSFWNSAASLRPAGLDWPAEAIESLKQFLSSNHYPVPAVGSASNNEAVLWETVGVLHLGRDEGKNSVLAFKKSEASLADSALRDEIQLLEARAMVAAGQPGAASAILIRMASSQGDNTVGQRAKAILGSMKLQNGSAAQGLGLLQSALIDTTGWPVSDRLQAQADFGLAQLMNGRESAGIATLEAVEKEFQESGLHDQARMCLLNLAAYYETTRQPKPHDETIARIEDLERVCW
jgi:hypothetical protein